jgi:hypothetical protein
LMLLPVTLERCTTITSVLPLIFFKICICMHNITSWQVSALPLYNDSPLPYTPLILNVVTKPDAYLDTEQVNAIALHVLSSSDCISAVHTAIAGALLLIQQEANPVLQKPLWRLTWPNAVKQNIH